MNACCSHEDALCEYGVCDEADCACFSTCSVTATKRDCGQAPAGFKWAKIAGTSHKGCTVDPVGLNVRDQCQLVAATEITVAKETVAQVESSATSPEHSKDNVTILLIDTVTYEPTVNMPPAIAVMQEQSKLTIIILELFLLGNCGIDRCVLAGCAFGSTGCCLGIVKGITMGGLQIWTAIDFVLLVVNGLQKSTYVNTLGLQARFDADDLESAYVASIIACVMVCVYFCCCYGGGKAATARAPREGQ